MEQVSRETVKNKIRRVEFPKKMGYLEEKKVVDYLYIDGDEDHVALQFRKQKGDIVENKQHQKNNVAIVKLIYVYEELEEEFIRGKLQKELGCLAEMKTDSIANTQIRKMLNCKHQICG